VLEHLAAHCEGCDPELADSLRKALPTPSIQSEHRALRELQGTLQEAYAEMIKRLNEQIVAAFEQEVSAHAASV
jgi:hypothetical protein